MMGTLRWTPEALAGRFTQVVEAVAKNWAGCPEDLAEYDGIIDHMRDGILASLDETVVILARHGQALPWDTAERAADLVVAAILARVAELRASDGRYPNTVP